MAGGTVACYRCGAACRSWRQCPDKACGAEIAACAAHGGDDEAIRLMVQHIDIARRAAPPPAKP